VVAAAFVPDFVELYDFEVEKERDVLRSVGFPSKLDRVFMG